MAFLLTLLKEATISDNFFSHRVEKGNGETPSLVLILNLKRLVDEVEVIETREDKCPCWVILKR